MEQFYFLDRILYHLKNHPQWKAFYIRDHYYSYGELARWVGGIQELIERETGDARYVGVLLADDIQTYASVLAIWMSGRAFVPINPHFPVARNSRIIDQMGLSHILCSVEPEPDPGFQGCRFVGTADPFPGTHEAKIKPGTQVGDDAYVLFTSGSTGNPKGVRISFENLNAFIRDFIDYPFYSFSPEDRFLQIYDLSFDASVHCYVVPLAIGASLYTVPSEGIKYLAAFKLLKEKRLTFAKMPPSTLSYLRPHFSSIHLPELRYCLLGGEAFPSGLAKDWEKCVPNALIQNVYGPTEATINCLIYNWNEKGSKRKEHQGTVCVGKTFGTNVSLVLGKDGNPSAPGEPGELLIAGGQVSPGYWKNAAQDEKSFIMYQTEAGVHRFYRTGDMVLQDEEGDIMFIRRDDEQIQVRGYRVELGEIESAARDFLDGSGVMAAGKDLGTGNIKIYLAIETAETDMHRLMNHLRKELPHFMIPDEVVAIPEFPRLVSGKLDRKAISDLMTQ